MFIKYCSLFGPSTVHSLQEGSLSSKHPHYYEIPIPVPHSLFHWVFRSATLYVAFRKQCLRLCITLSARELRRKSFHTLYAHLYSELSSLPCCLNCTQVLLIATFKFHVKAPAAFSSCNLVNLSSYAVMTYIELHPFMNVSP